MYSVQCITLYTIVYTLLHYRLVTLYRKAFFTSMYTTVVVYIPIPPITNPARLYEVLRIQTAECDACTAACDACVAACDAQLFNLQTRKSVLKYIYCKNIDL